MLLLQYGISPNPGPEKAKKSNLSFITYNLMDGRKLRRVLAKVRNSLQARLHAPGLPLNVSLRPFQTWTTAESATSNADRTAFLQSSDAAADVTSDQSSECLT